MSTLESKVNGIVSMVSDELPTIKTLQKVEQLLFCLNQYQKMDTIKTFNDHMFG